jgi:hypothetical protein
VTQQTIKEQGQAHTDGKCRSCVNYNQAALFEICTHDLSRYAVGAQNEYHTIQHMRNDSHCGESARLHRKKE